MGKCKTTAIFTCLVMALVLAGTLAERASASTDTSEKQVVPEELQFNKKPPTPLDVLKKYVKISISGAFQLDVIHDFQAVGWDGPTGGDGGFWTEFVTGAIPVRGSPASWYTNRTDFSINQTKFIVKLEAPTAWGDFRIVTKINLMGNATGGPDLNFYYGYAELGPLMVGQYYSTLFTYATVSDTLDFEGPNAIPEKVHPMIRVIQPVIPDLAVVFALEIPQADMTLPAGINAVNQVPDVMAGLQFQPDWATIRLMGIYRRFKAKGMQAGQTTIFDSSANGWGVCLSANVDTFGQDSIQFGGLGGEGLGNYIQDTIGLGLDAAPAYPGATDILPIGTYGAWIGYQHWWTYNLCSTATYAYVHMKPLIGQAPNAQPIEQGVYKHADYASINLIWSPIAPLDIGLEYLYGDRASTTGYGDNHRLMCSMIYNFGF